MPCAHPYLRSVSNESQNIYKLEEVRFSLLLNSTSIQVASCDRETDARQDHASNRGAQIDAATHKVYHVIPSRFCREKRLERQRDGAERHRETVRAP